EQIGEPCTPSRARHREVAPVGVHVLTEQRDLDHSPPGEALRLGLYVPAPAPLPRPPRAPARPCASASTSPIGRESCGPRTSGTMQNVHALSHPTAIETHAWCATSRSAGRALGEISVRSPHADSACVPPTTSTHGARSRIVLPSFCARHPATTIRIRGFACLSGRRCPRLP